MSSALNLKEEEYSKNTSGQWEDDDDSSGFEGKYTDDDCSEYEYEDGGGEEDDDIGVDDSADSESLKMSSLTPLVEGLMKNNDEVLLNCDPISCNICGHKADSGEGCVLPDCHHPFCLDCLGKYISTRLNFSNREDCWFVCPQEDCLNSIDIKALEDIFDEELNNRLIRFNHSNTCPTPGCSNALYCRKYNEPPIFDCFKCRTKSCLKCSASPYHYEKSCEEYYHYWMKNERTCTLKEAPAVVRNDKKLVIAALKRDGGELKYTSPEFQNDKDVVKVAVQQDRRAFQYASPELQSDKDVKDIVCQYWIEKLTSRRFALRNAPDFVRDDKKVVIAAVQANSGRTYQTLTPRLQGDKDVLIAALQTDGTTLQYVPQDLRKDKDVVTAAVKQNPDSIKYADNEIKRDPDVLIAAGMYDEVHDDSMQRRRQQQQQQMQNITTTTTTTIENDNDNNNNDCKNNVNIKIKKKIVLSTRFSLDASSCSEATNFTKLLKDYDYIHNNFVVYAPNAFDKKTCDPKWTDFNHPCRGTRQTCQYHNKLTKEGFPTDDCCWRYSFRNQLEEAKRTGGCMIQLLESVEENNKQSSDANADVLLGNGQKIERDMARQLGVKIFHIYRPTNHIGYPKTFLSNHIKIVVHAIQGWYDSECHDMLECEVHQGSRRLKRATIAKMKSKDR